MSNDPFTSARSGFLTMEDIEDCLVLVLPHEVETMNGDNGEYDMYRCTVMVLDGSPSEAIEGDFPITLEDFGISGAWTIGQIKRSLRTGKPTLGRVESFKNKRKTISYRLAEPTDEDMNLARPAAIELMRANDPFESSGEPADDEPRKAPDSAASAPSLPGKAAPRKAAASHKTATAPR